jgi:ABC-2 type transport system ATP-binding protein
MPTILSVSNLSKTYPSGLQALKTVSLDIERGEIFALLGPNGAGKTTLISIVCGIVTATTGTVTVGGHDIVERYREARSTIGLVPQELHTDMFETPWSTASFSRGPLRPAAQPRARRARAARPLALGEAQGPHHDALRRHEAPRDDRQGARARAAGAVPRRAHAGRGRGAAPRHVGAGAQLRDAGVTIILTTHYIEEAEEMADRIGVINKGELVVVRRRRS